MSRSKKSMSAMFGEINAETEKLAKTAPAPPRPKSTSSAGVMKEATRSIEDIVAERNQYQRLAEQGTGIIEIDPDLIDPSPFADRLPDDDHDEFVTFKQSLQIEGQKIPVQLRPHPNKADRYQVVFGHRRCRALKELATPVKAQIVGYDDTELVIAQGIENAQRQDLSWIEKALFADQMQIQGIKSGECQRALGVDRNEMSRFRLVTKTIPRNVIDAIGRAPKIGRPRWIELAELIKQCGGASRNSKMLSVAYIQGKTSDDRFAHLLTAFKQVVDDGAVTRKPPAADQQPLGEIGQATYRDGQVRLFIAKPYAETFNAYLKSELPKLVAQFIKSLEADKR